MLSLALLALAFAPFCTLVQGQKDLNITLAVAQVRPRCACARKDQC
jgi:hypothetical protein